jgi:hypothetical protein
VERVRAVPRLCELYPGICRRNEEKAQSCLFLVTVYQIFTQLFHISRPRSERFGGFYQGEKKSLDKLKQPQDTKTKTRNTPQIKTTQTIKRTRLIRPQTQHKEPQYAHLKF